MGKRKNPPPAAAPASAQPPLAQELASAFVSLKLEHPLELVFRDALAQATRGKGDARHGQGRDSSDPGNFMAQDWFAIARRHGPAFLSGQAEKKLREALELQRPERRGELLGVLVYVAMLIIFDDKVAR